VRIRIEAFGAGARPAFEALSRLLGPGRPAWLVGGAVRDALSGGGSADLDVAVPSGAIALARELAALLDGALYVLDEKRGAARVARGPAHAWRGPQIDIADFRASGLDGDLAARDFTVNALAVPIERLVADGEARVEDPTGGIGDLRERAVRLCSPRSFDDDPVRVLRAARLGAQAGWRLDPVLEASALEAAPGLAGTSAERARDEILGIFAGASSATGLRMLDRWGALEVFLPERAAMKATVQSLPHLFDVWEHSLRAVEAADLLVEHVRELAPWGDEIFEHLGEPLGDGGSRREAIKLAALLHDVAKPETMSVEAGRTRFIGHDAIGALRVGAIAGRLRLSGRMTAVLERLVRHHLRPMHLAQSGGVSRRARFRFFRDLGDEARDVLLLTLADAAGLRGDSPLDVWKGDGGRILRDLMAGHAEEIAALSAPPLLNGREAMAALGLPPGPEIGRLLRLLREAQAVGAVTTRAAALDYIRRMRDQPLDTSEPAP
jgi:poly(A) polymerase/tRNA nucleotidyltransferase (CCA-adding enzyme)